jgi:hypothetical protein
MVDQKTLLSENKKNKQVYIIIGLTIAVLAIIILFVFIVPNSTKGPVAGKATDYGDIVSDTVAGQFGIEIPTISAGAPWEHSQNGMEYDNLDVTGFVDFEAGVGTFYTMRLKLRYNSNVLEPISITPLHEKYTSDLGSEINIDDNSVLIYYTFSGSPKELETWTITGKKKLFKVNFKVIAPNPGDGNEKLYSGSDGDDTAVWLEDVPTTVSNDNSGSSYGIYKQALENVNVQIVDPTPNPKALSLTVYPGCQDEDGDGYALEVNDKQSCNGKLNPSAITNADCNDNNDQVYPGQTESCNGIDDNCIAGADEGLENKLGFNKNPENGALLKGVCLGYVSCVAGVETNSWELDGSDYSDEEICDNLDNDCDGEVDEDLPGCEPLDLLGGAGQSYEAADVFLSFDKNDDETYSLSGDPTVNSLDFYSAFIIKDLYQSSDTKPSCSDSGSNYICICKNGDYYRYNKVGGVLAGYYFVDYSAGTKVIHPDYYIDFVDQDPFLYDGGDVLVECEVPLE